MDIYKPLEAETDEEALALLDLTNQSIEALEDMAWFYCHTQGSSSAPMSARESLLADAVLTRLEELDPSDTK